jgi:hypothetical protein
MLEVSISHLLEEADFRARQAPTNEMTIRGLQGNQVGSLGELIGMEHLKRCGISYEEVFIKEYDVKFEHLEKSHTLEFKTKERTVVPQPHYGCSVFYYHHDFQKPDYYMFISLVSTNNKSDDIHRFVRGFILGSIDRKTFEKKSLLWTPDNTDFSNNWTPKKSTYNVSVSDLQPPLVLDRVC